MYFINECGCICDTDALIVSIINKCKKQNKQVKDCYRIMLRNGYPSVCIAHNRYYVHRLVWEGVHGVLEEEQIIHHKDQNKLNNNINNLECLTNEQHSQLHGAARKDLDLRSESGKWRSVESAAKKRYRREITKEKIVSMQKQGLTIGEIAKKLNCGKNTICRRLHGREYVVSQRALDWSGEYEQRNT